jgi:hypothetical protein
MNTLLITSQNSLGLHLRDMLKNNNLKTMFMDSSDGDYNFTSFDKINIPDLFDDAIFVLDYQDWLFNFNQQQMWNEFIEKEMFDKIFSRLFYTIKNIKFKNFILLSSQQATNLNSVSGFWYNKAEEITE